jgi:drug/metabolite transporter (DMT)-like permease
MSNGIAPIEERRMLGIGIVLLSQLFGAMIDPSAKWLSGAGLPTTEIIFVRYGVHLLMVLAVFLPQGPAALVRTRNLKLELARGFALFGATVFNFLAVRFLPVTMTGAIQFTLPLIVCVLSIPLLGEIVGWRRWSAIVVGFIGVLVIIRPGTGDFNPAVFLSLGGATSGAFYSILMRKLAGVDSPATQQFYASLLAVACIAPFAFGNWVWPQDAASWGALALVGIAGMLTHQLVTVAARYAPASVLAPFSYLQIVYLSLISWLLFKQPPTAWLFAGAVIVIGSGIYLGLRERKLARPITPPMVED